MEEDILALALELAGLEEGEAQGLPLACRLARQELESMLKRGVRAADCGEAFLAAAAKLALADWMDLRGAGQPRKFTAGELSVEEADGGDHEGLRRQALRQMAPFVEDGGVYLKGVRS